MKHGLKLLIVGLFAAALPLAHADEAATTASDAKPVVELQTNVGTLVVELWPSTAPKTVENFLKYVDDGFYNGTIFHRIVPNFVIQAGGFGTDLKKKDVRPPIPLEAGARNDRYTLSMARTNNPNSATSQFYVNLRNNANLNPGGMGPGYAVFGKVIDGTDIVDRIGRMRTSNRGGAFASLPETQVVIEKAVRAATKKAEPAK